MTDTTTLDAPGTRSSPEEQAGPVRRGPMTDNPDERKVRVNIDLAAWIPEDSTHKDAARTFLTARPVAAPRAARPRAGPHQAGRGRRRCARQQPVGIGPVAVRALSR